jgi:hypothetical protein
MLALSSFSAGFAPMATAIVPRLVFSSSIKMETVADLKKLANELNPILGCEHAVLSRTPLVPNRSLTLARTPPICCPDWNPLGLADDNHMGLGFQGNLWDKDQAETIGWFRQAEIKHGRVAMFGFVGYLVQSAGVHWPWDITPGHPFAEISAAGGPGDQWDALPANAKWQIILFAGLMEIFGEAAPRIDGSPHYMRGAPCSTRACSAHAAAAPVTAPARL